MAVDVPAVVAGRAGMATGPTRIRTDSAPRPARLTSRGRIVVTGVSALLAGVLSVGLAAAAQAARGGHPAGRYVAKVLVTPGQSLWSLALANDPHSDPRQVVGQIRQLNSMTGDQLRAGELVWVPRG
jgi:hypothetical protein